jgi:hypothetical protein
MWLPPQKYARPLRGTVLPMAGNEESKRLAGNVSSGMTLASDLLK